MLFFNIEKELKKDNPLVPPFVSYRYRNRYREAGNFSTFNLNKSQQHKYNDCSKGMDEQ